MNATRLSLTALVLVGASAFAISAFAAAPAAPAAAAGAAPAAPAPLDPKIKTFATLPSAEGSENLCQQADGSLYVTLINTKQVMKVAPDGRVSEFVSAPAMMHALGVGCGDNEVAVVFYGKTFRGAPAVAATATTPAVPAGPLHFDDTDTRVYVYDLSGKMTGDIAAAKGVGLNGFAYSGSPGLYYSTNSNGGDVYTVNTKTKAIMQWFNEPMLGPAAGAPIGLNGVRVKNGWVYVSVGTQGMHPKRGLYRIQIGADGKASGAPAKLEDAIAVDDFDVAANGDVYFPAGTTLYRVASTGGDPVKVADPIQGGPSAVVARDGKSVLWPTRGGAANQRVLQVAIP